MANSGFVNKRSPYFKVRWAEPIKTVPAPVEVDFYLAGKGLQEELLCPAWADLLQKLGCILGLAGPSVPPTGIHQLLFPLTTGSKPTSDCRKGYFAYCLIIYLHVNSFYSLFF